MWRGVIIEESLEDKSLLKLAKIDETKKSTLENEEEERKRDKSSPSRLSDGEAGILTFHKIELLDDKKAEFLKMARTAIKDTFYLHVCKNGVMIVVYRNKVFEFSKNETGKINEAREYGAAHGILREQLEFEVLIDDPWA